MSATVLYMSMSLDGFIAGPNEGPGNGLGDGGLRLHEWADQHSRRQPPGHGEFLATGAVVAGRGTFEPAGGWGGDHHDGVPIFILSRRGSDSEIEQWPLVSYVNDVRTAMPAAKRAAGDKNVLVHGAGTAQLALAAGVLDELEIHVIPVLLGQGRRLFDNLDPEHIELERTRILEGESGVTHSASLLRWPLRGGVSRRCSGGSWGWLDSCTPRWSCSLSECPSTAPFCGCWSLDKGGPEARVDVCASARSVATREIIMIEVVGVDSHIATVAACAVDAAGRELGIARVRKRPGRPRRVRGLDRRARSHGLPDRGRGRAGLRVRARRAPARGGARGRRGARAPDPARDQAPARPRPQ